MHLTGRLKLPQLHPEHLNPSSSRSFPMGQGKSPASDRHLVSRLCLCFMVKLQDRLLQELLQDLPGKVSLPHKASSRPCPELLSHLSQHSPCRASQEELHCSDSLTRGRGRWIPSETSCTECLSSLITSRCSQEAPTFLNKESCPSKNQRQQGRKILVQI